MAFYSDSGLRELRFPSAKPQPKSAPTTAAVAPKIQEWHRAATSAVNLLLAGKAPRLLPPLDLSSGTTFQQRVWQALRRIPLGHTSTYAQVARAVGSPRAVRAVGGACGANPVPVLIPCHRVVASHGLGGFSGGLAWKRLLLEREKADQLLHPLNADISQSATPSH